MSDNNDLASKIAQAKLRLPLKDLLERLGFPNSAKTTAHCPFSWHEDKHPSFSVFRGEHGWQWICFAGCGGGDEITFLSTLNGISRSDAICVYLEMAGFPRLRPPASREYPESRCVSASPASRVSLVSLVSKGQGGDAVTDEELMKLAARHACRGRKSTGKRRFKLAQDLAGVQERIGRSLVIAELKIAAYEWYRLSEPYLDLKESREDHLMALTAEIGKVLHPTGTSVVKEALQKAAKLALDQLPMIPEYPDAPEELRRLAAVHREIWQANGGKQYLLSYRDAASVVLDMHAQKAHHMTLVLQRFGLIKIISKGKPGANSGLAAEFLYLLSQSEDADEEPLDL